MSRPTAIAAIWIKKSFHLRTDSWGAWTSSIGAEISGVESASVSWSPAALSLSAGIREISCSTQSAIDALFINVAVADAKL
jgi:hypothetical protein